MVGYHENFKRVPAIYKLLRLYTLDSVESTWLSLQFEQCGVQRNAALRYEPVLDKSTQNFDHQNNLDDKASRIVDPRLTR